MPAEDDQQSPASVEARRVAVRATLALGIVMIVMALTQGGPSYFVGFGEESPLLGPGHGILGDGVSVPLAAGFGVIAGLAKESSALGIAAVALGSRGLALRDRALVAVSAAVSMGAWRAYVISRPGFESDPEVQEFALIPFSGFEEAWRRGWVPNDHWVYSAISFALIPLAVLVIRWWWARRDSVELLAALPYAPYLPSLSGQVLSIPVNSLRAFGPAIRLAGMGWLWERTDPRHSLAAFAAPRQASDGGPL